MWRVRSDKPDPSMMANGMLAGLVAITAPCAFVNSISACIIGMISGVLVGEGVFFKAAETEGLDLPEMGVPGYVGIETAREEIV